MEPAEYGFQATEVCSVPGRRQGFHLFASQGCGNEERGIFLIQDALLMPLFWLSPPWRDADSGIGSSQEDWQLV